MYASYKLVAHQLEERTDISTYLQCESAVFGDQCSAKPHVVAVDEGASIALAVHHREVDCITGSKWLPFQIARKTPAE